MSAAEDIKDRQVAAQWALRDFENCLKNFPSYGSVYFQKAIEAINCLAVLASANELDARRYAWLREACISGPLTIAESDSWALQPWSGDDPDRKIDAAMKDKP